MSNVQPNVASMFEAVAFRIGHSIVPPGFYVRYILAIFLRSISKIVVLFKSCFILDYLIV